MTIWFTMRGAGLTALVLLTITTCIGVLVSGGGRPDLRYVVQYVHRVTASLGLGVLTLHVVTALMDSYAGVGITGAIVPFTSGYRATWVGLGTIAAYLIVLVAATGFARGRIAASEKGAAIWRTVHGLSYGAWGLALIHGFESGTDSGQTWVRILFLVCLAAVPTCLALRNPSPKHNPSPKVVAR
jgi:sulfoxide reductase heme-binding subunit YedZ